MKIAFCDDDPTERRTLGTALSAWAMAHSVPLTLLPFDSGDALLTAYKKQPFDAAILDIYMPGLGGLETARHLRTLDENLPIIFLTSSTEHYADGFDVAACHYLVKPLEQAKLEQAMQRLLKLTSAQEAAIVVPVGRREERILQRSIRYIETVRNGVNIHCSDCTLTVRYPLSNLLAQLDARLFVQCHRFYIVNLAAIADEEEECFVLKDGTRLLIRKEGRKEIKEAYHRFFLAQMRGEL